MLCCILQGMNGAQKETLCKVTAHGVLLPDGTLEGRVDAALCCDDLAAFPRQLFLHIELYARGKMPKGMAYGNAIGVPTEEGILLSLPERQLVRARIDGAALLVSLQDHYELWQPARYDLYLQAVAVDNAHSC